MTRKEFTQVCQEQLDIYAGILFHNQIFAPGEQGGIEYHLDCPEFKTLREKYDLEKLAGKGSDFVRSKRLLHYLAPRLTHSSWYDNSVPCNAISLLEYSLNNPEQGINCLNKSKILEECCLALGIYARRVFIMPYSPYDFDNHVVTEIYDRDLEKWIMLDPTTDGYFVDDGGTPLSLLEMRTRFANERFVTFIPANAPVKDLTRRREKNLPQNSYICKNLFYFMIGKQAWFGEPNGHYAFAPSGYSIRDCRIGNARYRINRMPPEYEEFIEEARQRLEALENAPEQMLTALSVMEAPPMTRG